MPSLWLWEESNDPARMSPFKPSSLLLFLQESSVAPLNLQVAELGLWLYTIMFWNPAQVMAMVRFNNSLPRWPSGEESACSAGDAGDVGSITGSGRSPGGGHSNPLQDSCRESPIDRGAWWATVCGVAKSWTWLKGLSTHTDSITLVDKWMDVLNVKGKQQ